MNEESSSALEKLILGWIKNQPRYRNIKEKHVTVFFRTNMPDDLIRHMEENEGRRHSIIIDGIGISQKVIAVRVKFCCNSSGEETSSMNKEQHTTLATFNGGKPVESNSIDLWFDIPQVTLEGCGKTVYSK